MSLNPAFKLCICVMSLVCATALAQTSDTTSNSSSSWVRTSASIGMSSDYYSQTGSSAPSTFPSSVHRATLRANVTLFDQIDLPFEMYITSNELAYRQPFNQFGISPKFGNWLQLHAGYFSMRMSDFTFGDARLLGGGAEFTPGNFRLGVFYGYSRLARDVSPENGFIGEYQRRIIGGKIGYGDQSGSFFMLNVIHAQDDSISIRRDSTTPDPQENFVTSLSFGLNLFENIIRFTGEGAIGFFTANTKAPLIDSAEQIELVDRIFRYNISTNVDAAGKLGLLLTPSKYWNIRFDASWIGPGFVTLGFVQMPNDIFDLTVTPSVRLFSSRLFLRGSYGQRTNNLRNTRFAPTTRTIGMVNVSANFTDNIGLDVMYSNFGMRSTHINQIIRVENISQMVTITPRATFTLFDAQNSASLTISRQNSEDLNQFSLQSVNNSVNSYSAVHVIAFPSTLSFSTTIFRNQIENQISNSDITTVSETVGYSFFENMLNLNGTIGLNFINAQGAQKQILARLGATLNLNSYGSFTLMLLNNNYDYSAVTLNRQPNYSEYQGSLQYNLSF